MISIGGSIVMKSSRILSAVIFTSLALFFTAAPFTAGADDASLLPPQRVIQETSTQLQTTLQRPEYKNNFPKAVQFVEGVIDPHVDFDRVAMLILGKYWKVATPEQKQSFKKEFRTLLVRTYTTAFTEYSNWTIRYSPLDIEAGAKRIEVKTEILRKDGEPVRVGYRMENANNDWKVYDILIEGISLVQNYRTSFTGDIERYGSLDRLIGVLAQRNADAASGQASSANPS
jgi:phospholipid transport system substrate-binding protein